jgi:hypothetical protein
MKEKKYDNKNKMGIEEGGLYEKGREMEEDKEG